MSQPSEMPNSLLSHIRAGRAHVRYRWDDAWFAGTTLDHFWRSMMSPESPEVSGLRRHQRPEHVHIEVASRRVGIAIDLPAGASQPVPVRLAPLAHRVMGVADPSDRAGVGRGGDEPARQR